MKYLNTQGQITPCGSSWEFCHGVCSICHKRKIITSTNSVPYEEVYGRETTTDNKTRWFGTYSGEHKD